jgi:hypothetical protein
MKSSVEKNFLEVYNPIINQFIESIKEVNYENIAEPSIPAWGSEYENCEHKLAFVGMETNNQWGMPNGGLNNWIKFFPLDLESKKAIFLEYNNNEINQFTIWEDGRKSIFLKFVKAFLIAFYYSPNTKEIRDKKILNSFIYANVNSFVVPANAPEGNEVWNEIKNASKIFDKAEHIVKAFGPNIIVRLYWDRNNADYFNSYKGFLDSEESVKEKEIYYYFIKETNTHIYWTKHPSFMPRDKGFDFYINNIIKHIYDKKIFTEFPGQHTTVRLIDLIANIEKEIRDIGEKPECDTVDMTYEPFFRINNFRLYFNPYQVYSEKIFQIKLLVVKDNLENWNINKIEFEKKYHEIDWAEPESRGGWFIIGSKTYININDLDISQFQDYLKSIYYNDWKDIVNELKK